MIQIPKEIAKELSDLTFESLCSQHPGDTNGLYMMTRALQYAVSGRHDRSVECVKQSIREMNHENKSS